LATGKTLKKLNELLEFANSDACPDGETETIFSLVRGFVCGWVEEETNAKTRRELFSFLETK
jgi:hypothetical protein